MKQHKIRLNELANKNYQSTFEIESQLVFALQILKCNIKWQLMKGNDSIFAIR